MQTIFVIVLGYEGIIKDDYLRYKEYIKFACLLIRKLTDKYFVKVIVCGGHTNLKNPNVSEAKFLRDIMRRRLKRTHNYVIIPEDKSLDKKENLAFAKKIMQKELKGIKLAKNTENVFIICDSMQNIQINTDARNCFAANGNNLFKYKIVFYNGIKHSFWQIIGQIMATIKDWFCQICPWIEDEFIHLRELQLHVNHKDRI